jgi:hypothetical protein
MATKKKAAPPKKVTLPSVKTKKGYIFDPKYGYVKLKK